MQNLHAPSPASGPVERFVRGVLAFVVRAVFAVSAVIVLALSFAIGLTLFAVALVWALLRGRRPTTRFQFQRRAWPPGGFGGGMGRPAAGRGEIVEAEVREVPPAPPSTGR